MRSALRCATCKLWFGSDWDLRKHVCRGAAGTSTEEQDGFALLEPGTPYYLRVTQPAIEYDNQPTPNDYAGLGGSSGGAGATSDWGSSTGSTDSGSSSSSDAGSSSDSGGSSGGSGD